MMGGVVGRGARASRVAKLAVVETRLSVRIAERLELAIQAIKVLVTTGRLPQMLHPIHEAGALRELALKVHSMEKTKRALQQTAVVIAELRRGDNVEYWASGSSGRLSILQKAYLHLGGVTHIVSGPGHAEENIGRALPEGAQVERWGIAWTTAQVTVHALP
jgi:hypothetical protein